MILKITIAFKFYVVVTGVINYLGWDIDRDKMKINLL